MSKYLIKKAKKPCSPLKKAWKILFFFSLGVQHVVKELSPQLWAKLMKKRAGQKRYQRKTLTCHQRLKLSFTTHLFFTVLTWFSFVICQNAENQTHLNIFAEKKTIGRTRNAKIIEMVLSLINHVLHIDQIWCLLDEPGVPQGIVLAPLDFPIQGQLLYQSQLAASSALAWEILDHYKF